MHAPGIIEKKRNGEALTDEEIAWFIDGFTAGRLPDYQMSALAMAIFFQGMEDRETGCLTQTMMRSGRVFEYPADAPPVVDKHSTGGVGDKVSLVLAPLLAADGLWVPMISGRGLGITGGTLDKLESIPGFQVGLTLKDAMRQLEQIGVFMIGQSGDICPADRKLYALRDVTGTVPSRPLICASIMSKKLAENLDRLVLDVKFGSGAFMNSRQEAEALARDLTAAAEPFKTEVSTVLSPMNEPLGEAVGNALEVAEAVDTLQGKGPADLRELVLELASKVSRSEKNELAAKLDSGEAWEKWKQLVEAQGGDVVLLENLRAHHRAEVTGSFEAPSDGILRRFDARKVGETAVRLGAGRARVEDDVDFTVGFSRLAKTGVRVGKGQPLAEVHARSREDLDFAFKKLAEAVEIE